MRAYLEVADPAPVAAKAGMVVVAGIGLAVETMVVTVAPVFVALLAPLDIVTVLMVVVAGCIGVVVVA